MTVEDYRGAQRRRDELSRKRSVDGLTRPETKELQRLRDECLAFLQNACFRYPVWPL